MSPDLLQISLEHHRAGRVRQAEAGYRALLQADPDHADALHWLGVLTVQAGRPDEAVPLLERAAARRPDDAAFHHNLGEAYLAAGRAADAVAAFEAAGRIEPDRADGAVALARALLARRAPGDAGAAAAALRVAHAAGLDSAESHRLLGAALLHADRPGEAVAAFQDALRTRPDDPSLPYQLALAHRAKGDVKAARKALNKALEAEPALARAWHALATLDAEAGNLDIAAGLFRRAIKFQPGFAAAHAGLAEVLRRAGRAAEADAARADAERAAAAETGDPAAPAGGPRSVAELERRLTPDPAAAHLHFALATLFKLTPPVQTPTKSVTQLFDRYAVTFDEHLRGRLEYRAPELIAEAVAAAVGPAASRRLDVLDLGCGTGLCGPLLRGMAATLAGVDLSPAMIERARARGVYDRLDLGDIVDALRAAPRSFDLVVAADVFVYVGELVATFEATAAALRPGGLFAFTVEAIPDEGERFHFDTNTHRYAHSKAYLQRLATIYGFEEQAFADATLRVNYGAPVAGYVVVLRVPGG